MNFDYDYLSLDVIQTLINEKGLGSLARKLKEEGLIIQMNANENSCDGQETDLFCIPWIGIKLTDEGFKKVPRVIELVGEYLNMMQDKEIPDDFYEDYLKIEELTFQYADQSDEEYLTQSITQNMDYVEPENLVKKVAHRVPTKKDAKHLKEVLKPYVLSKCRIDIQGQEMPEYIKEHKIDKSKDYETVIPYFETQSTRLDLKSFIGEQTHQKVLSGYYGSYFHYPSKNEFMPDHVTVEELDGDKYTIPVNLSESEDDVIQAYYSQDLVYRIPKACLVANMLFSAKHDPMNRIYFDILQNYLHDEYQAGPGYQAYKASFQSYVDRNDHVGIEFFISGFSSKSCLLYRRALEFIFDCFINPKESTFKRARESRIRNCIKYMNNSDVYMEVAVVGVLYTFTCPVETRKKLLEQQATFEGFK